MQTIQLLEKNALTDSLFHLRFSRPKHWNYQAGQFARIGLALNRGEPVFRAYSMSSNPIEPTLDFLIKRVEGGTLSPTLTGLEVGAEVLLDGEAEGNLLPSRIPGGDTMWFFATGAGLAPFLSLLKDPDAISEWDTVILALSARGVKEVDALADAAIQTNHKKLRILTTTTREPSPLEGRITTLIESGKIEELAEHKLVPESARTMLCGNPDFIKEMRALLKARGLISPRFGNPGQLLVESLW